MLSEAKIFVLPSQNESFPVCILEAAAFMKSVIVSDIPELSFVLKEGFGLSFKSGSADDLSEKIVFCLITIPKEQKWAKLAEDMRAIFSGIK